MPFIPKSTGIPTVDKVFKEVFAILNRFQGGKVASSSDEPVDWADIVNKPTTFPPESHTQDISTINNLQTTLDDKQPVHANLTSISNLSTTPSGRFLVTNGSAIVARPLQNSDLPAIAITDTFVVASQSAMLALSAAERGDVAVRTDLNKSFILKGDNPASLSDWQELLSPTDAVLSVDGRTGVVSLSDKYQPLDSDLTVIAGLTHSNRHVMVSNGSSWTRRALEEADLPSLSISKITGLQSVLDGKSNTGHNHDRLIGIVDTRAVATTPNDYPKSVIPQFKTNTAIGLSAGGTYSTILGIFGWNDASGGHAHELAFSSSGIYNRIGPPGSSWGNWKRLLTTEDISTTVAPASHTHPWSGITDKPSTFTPSSHNHAWGDITGKPSTFAPAAHGLVSSTHTVSGLTTGHVMKALSATSFGFEALTPSEIGAPAIGPERSLSITTAGWVTIATCATGRAYGEFHVYDPTSGRHNFTKIIASTSYGVNSVSVIGGNRYSTRTIAHVRVLYNTSDRTYGGAKLQVYCENPTFTLYVKQFLSQEFTSWKSWNNVTPVAEGTPTGWAQDDSTYLQDITNPNYSFTGNVFSGKGLLLSGNATISGNTAFGKTTFVGGNRIEVAGGALIEGKLTGRNALEIWGHSYLGNNLNVGGLLSFMYDGNYVTFAGRNVSNTVDLLNIAKINDMNVFERGFYVNDGNISIYGNRVNMSRRNVGGAAIINITTNPQIIDLNDYPRTSRFDITTSMADAPEVYFKNAIPGDEIFVKIVKSGPYASEYGMVLGWNIDPHDGTWMRYATKRYFHLICEGTATASGITANTWWIAGVHGLYQP